MDKLRGEVATLSTSVPVAGRTRAPRCMEGVPGCPVACILVGPVCVEQHHRNCWALDLQMISASWEGVHQKTWAGWHLGCHKGPACLPQGDWL